MRLPRRVVERVRERGPPPLNAVGLARGLARPTLRRSPRHQEQHVASCRLPVRVTPAGGIVEPTAVILQVNPDTPEHTLPRGDGAEGRVVGPLPRPPDPLAGRDAVAEGADTVWVGRQGR